jgi:hypothetical protein
MAENAVSEMSGKRTRRESITKTKKMLLIGS